jgi:hypothetical protein
LVLIKGNKWTFRRPLDKIRSITTRGHGAAEKKIFIKLTQHYRIAFTESQCYYKTIADLINGNETERCMTMSIGNNIERREPFRAWISRGSIAYISIIVAVSLLAAGDSFILLSSPPMIRATTTAAAQEEDIIINNNNTATTEPTTATTDGDTNTTAKSTTPLLSSEIHLSPQPIWEERVRNTGETPFNQTHSIITFFGNGTLTVPDTGETIDVTNNGTAIFSSVRGTSFGRESFFSEDGDSTAITFYEIEKEDPATLQTRGITTAVFDSNATGSLAPFNGMIVVGLHDEQPNEEGVNMTLWKWED